MNTNTHTGPWRRLCIGAAAAGGLAASMLGLASGTGQAAPHPAPVNHYHWCPGQQWNPSWGNNWDQNNCHDWDDDAGPAGWGPPPAWTPPQPRPPTWAPWAHPVWNPGMNHWGFWHNGQWNQL